MPDAGRPTIKKKVNDRMSSPERLHELMPLVNRYDWIAVTALATTVAAFMIWAAYGQVPLSAVARGVFVRSRHVVDWQAGNDGRIESLNVREGDSVRHGTVLGYIDQSEIRKRLQQNRMLVAELTSQDLTKSQLEEQELRLLAQRAQLEHKSIQAQRQNFLDTEQMLDRMAPLLQDRLRSMRELQRSKLVASAAVEIIDAERASLENTTRMSETRSKLEQLATAEKDLEQQAERLRQTHLDASVARRNAIQQLSRDIAVDEVALQKNGQIVSQYDGKIVELLARPGQFVNAGTRLASIELSKSAGDLECILYVPINHGKRIQPGMSVQVTPDIVERERFGGIVGHAVSVSPYPVTTEGAVVTTGSAEVAHALTADGPAIEVRVALDSDQRTVSRYRWSSSQGPPMQITAGTTTTARIILEREPAMNYVMPFVRSVVGIR